MFTKICKQLSSKVVNTPACLAISSFNGSYLKLQLNSQTYYDYLICTAAAGSHIVSDLGSQYDLHDNSVLCLIFHSHQANTLKTVKMTVPVKSVEQQPSSFYNTCLICSTRLVQAQISPLNKTLTIWELNQPSSIDMVVSLNSVNKIKSRIALKQIRIDFSFHIENCKNVFFLQNLKQSNHNQ